MTTHSAVLVTQAFLSAIHKHPPPSVLHSDHGSEYCSKDYLAIIRNLGIEVSMSKKALPGRTATKNLFTPSLKVDLGDPNRFQNLGELVYAVYQTIYSYNHSRIHTKLKMPPAIFAERHIERSNQLVETVS